MPTEIMNAYQFLVAFVICSGAIVIVSQAVSRARADCLLQAKTVSTPASRGHRYGR